MTDERKPDAKGTCDGQVRRLIDAHFKGRGAPGDMAQVQLHLDDCDDCRAYFKRHQLLAQMDPKGLSAEQRVGRSLGLARGTPWWRAPAGAFAGASVAAVAAAVLIVPNLTPDAATRMQDPAGGTAGDAAGDGFQARGNGRVLEKLGDTVVVYRVQEGEKPAVLDGGMAAEDELAFAYRNETGWRNLMVFGVDEADNIYWYHPAWTDASANPRAVPIEKAEALTELPEAVAHDIQGRILEVYAIFTNDQPSVREIEAAIAARRERHGKRGPVVDGATLVRVVRVGQ